MDFLSHPNAHDIFLYSTSVILCNSEVNSLRGWSNFRCFKRSSSWASTAEKKVRIFNGMILGIHQSRKKEKCSKTCLKQPFKKKTKIGFQDQLSHNAGQTYCRMLQESILQYF